MKEKHYSNKTKSLNMLITYRSQYIVPGYFQKFPYMSITPISIRKSARIPIKQSQFSKKAIHYYPNDGVKTQQKGQLEKA